MVFIRDILIALEMFLVSVRLHSENNLGLAELFWLFGVMAFVLAMAKQGHACERKARNVRKNSAP